MPLEGKSNQTWNLLLLAFLSFPIVRDKSPIVFSFCKHEAQCMITNGFYDTSTLCMKSMACTVEDTSSSPKYELWQLGFKSVHAIVEIFLNQSCAT